VNYQNKAALDRVIVAGGALKSTISLSELDKAFPELFSKAGGETTAVQSFSAVSWVYRCVNLRSDTLAGLPRSFYRLGDDEKTDPPAVYADVDFNHLLWLTEAARCIWGVSYWERDPGLHWLNPSTMSIIVRDNVIVGFRQSVMRAESELFGPDDLVYLPMFNPMDDLGPGISPATVALTAAGLSSALLKWAEAFFEHGAIPAVILTTDQSIKKDDPELDRISATWKKMLGGLKNAWETIVLSKGLTPTVISPPVKDLVIPELSKQVREELSASFGIPITMLQQSAANYATAREDRQSYYLDTMFPEAKRIAAALNRQLWRPLGYELRFDFNEVEAIQQDEAEKADAIAAMMEQVGDQYEDQILTRKRSVWLVEQLWDQMGMKFPDELADEGPQPQPQPEEPKTSEEPEVVEEPENAKAVILPPDISVIQNIRKDLRRWRRKVGSRGPNCTFTSDCIPEQTAKAVRLRLLNGCKDVFRPWLGSKALDQVAEQAIIAAIQAIFDEYLPGIVGALEAGDMPDLEDMYRQIRGATIPIYQDVLAEQALANAADLGWGMDYEDLLIDANDWARTRAGAMANQLSVTDNKRFISILDSLQRGEVASDAIPGLLGGLFGPVRADMTGITETTHAMRQAAARLAANMRASGIEVVERWLTAEDERVCPICAPLDHTTEEVWGQAIAGGPPAHYNCRCRIAVEYKQKVQS